VGYYLLEQGYDCWFVNLRGTLFNLSHKNPNISAEEFFDYTIYDHSLIDIPCFYENISKFYENQKIISIAYSLSSLMLHIALSDDSTCKMINDKTECVMLFAALSFPGENQDPYC